jgi:uncharacterized protein (DUF2345 family)
MENNNRGTSGKKRDDKNIEYGNKNGTIKFGHLHLGSGDELDSDVQSGVMLQALDSRHYMTLDNDGVRKGWTLNRSPGPHEIKCATDSAGTENSDEGIGFLLIAEKGDIVLRAPNGRIRMSAQDIHIRADGEDNTRGAVVIDANEAVNINTLRFSVKAKSGIKMSTPYTMDLIANTSMNMYSNFMNGLSSASAFLADKSYLGSTEEFIKTTVY